MEFRLHLQWIASFTTTNKTRFFFLNKAQFIPNTFPTVKLHFRKENLFKKNKPRYKSGKVR